MHIGSPPLSGILHVRLVGCCVIFAELLFADEAVRLLFHSSTLYDVQVRGEWSVVLRLMTRWAVEYLSLVSRLQSDPTF